MSSLPNVNANFTATAPLGKTIHNIYIIIYIVYILSIQMNILLCIIYAYNYKSIYARMYIYIQICNNYTYYCRKL